jgi:type IV secretion system protein VirB9
MRLVFLLLLCVFARAAYSAESSVLQLTYHPGHPYRLILSPLYVTSVHFEGGHAIEHVYCGDGSAWEVSRSSVARNSLLIKPKIVGSKTDLLVRVDGKIVLFRVESSRQVSGQPLIFVNVQLPHLKRVLQHRSTYHSYCFKGNESLRPVWMFDSGEFTYFSWPRNKSLPAIYRLSATGKKLYMTNFRIHNRIFLLPRISQRWLLRRGDDCAILQRVHYQNGRRICHG